MNYGKSKMYAEQKVVDQSKNIEVVILRPPWFYGPGQPRRQNLFFSMIKNGQVPLVGNGNNRRSMAYVDNICQGMLLADKIDAAKDQIYWIADRCAYTMNEIIDTIESLLENDFSLPVAHKRMRLPNITSDVAGAIDGILQTLGLYNQKIHVLSEMNKTIACSITKAERELGYDPKVSLREGMRRSIAWLSDQGIGI
jgi:nucleoside-diphosphate-sugar epimerase